ncbi:MAG TPA: hypothetical protein VK986_24215, partial [Tepidisphaeraceae bacterium]|nr:hypothetical protein [Tepidisphaeraceae bacterium]
GGEAQLIDAVTGHAPNAGHGTCADVPGPYTPPPPPPDPALVVSMVINPDGNSVTMTFDTALDIVSTPISPDGSILVAGQIPQTIVVVDTHTVELAMGFLLNVGDPWQIVSQPAWLYTPVANPADGTLS